MTYINKKTVAAIYDQLANKKAQDIEDILVSIFSAKEYKFGLYTKEYTVGLYIYRMAYSGETSFFVAEYPFYKLRSGVDDSRYPTQGFVAAAVELAAAKDFVDVRDIATKLTVDDDHLYWLIVRLDEMNDVFLKRGALKIGVKSNAEKILTIPARKYLTDDPHKYSILARGRKPTRLILNSYQNPNMDNLIEEKTEIQEVESKGSSTKDITQKLHEANIESIIVQNLELMEKGLVLVQRQFVCPGVGRIDLLCKDRDSNLVIIELKAFGTKQNTIIDQIARYMGWIKVHMAKENQQVRGFIIVPKADEKLGYAVGAMPNVEIKTFSISFP